MEVLHMKHTPILTYSPTPLTRNTFYEAYSHNVFDAHYIVSVIGYNWS